LLGDENFEILLTDRKLEKQIFLTLITGLKECLMMKVGLRQRIELLQGINA